MLRSRFKNNFSKKKFDENWNNYKEQRQLSDKLFRKIF